MGANGVAAIQAGGLVVDVLYAGPFGAPPTQDELKAWIQAEDLHVTVVEPKPGDPTLQELQSREWWYLVDLKTMKIGWTGFGSYGGSSQSDSTAAEAFSQLMSALGK